MSPHPVHPSRRRSPPLVLPPPWPGPAPSKTSPAVLSMMRKAHALGPEGFLLVRLMAAQLPRRRRALVETSPPSPPQLPHKPPARPTSSRGVALSDHSISCEGNRPAALLQRTPIPKQSRVCVCASYIERVNNGDRSILRIPDRTVSFAIAPSCAHSLDPQSRARGRRKHFQ